MLPTDLQPWDVPRGRYGQLAVELKKFGPNGVLSQVLVNPNAPSRPPARAIALGGTNDLERALGFIVMLGSNAIVSLRNAAGLDAAHVVLDRLQVSTVTGPVETVDQLKIRLPVNRVAACPLMVTSHADPVLSADPRVRPAAEADVPEIQRLLVETGFGPETAGHDSFTVLMEQVALGLVHVGVERGIVAAVASASGWTEDFLFWDTLAVRPSHRRRGLAVGVCIALAHLAYERGLGVCWLNAETSAMEFPDVPLIRTTRSIPWTTLHFEWSTRGHEVAGAREPAP